MQSGEGEDLGKWFGGKSGEGGKSVDVSQEKRGQARKGHTRFSLDHQLTPTDS